MNHKERGEMAHTFFGLFIYEFRFVSGANQDESNTLRTMSVTS